MKTRFNAYEKTLYEFTDHVYVICPKCESQAIVKSKKVSEIKTGKDVRLICSKCGVNKYYSETSINKRFCESSGTTQGVGMSLGANTDPYFKLPLWLQKEMSYGILWAYNYEHLNFLENHIGAELRHRDSSKIQNKSIGSRLPKWMTSKKNRTELLNEIEKLKQK